MGSSKSFLSQVTSCQVFGHSDKDSKGHRDICNLHNSEVQMGATCRHLGPDSVIPYGEVTPQLQLF